MIPTNVAKAANFYQANGRLHGQSNIRAADPTRTNIIGNFRFDYTNVPYTCDKYPWYNRILSKAHTQIECDPMVWSKAEALILQTCPRLQEPDHSNHHLSPHMSFIDQTANF